MSKKFLLIIIILLLGSSVEALTLVSPDDQERDVSLTSYFVWDAVSGADKYVLDIHLFTQSEDNILSRDFCIGGTCSFAFLDLTIGNINYGGQYMWKVTAYNAEGKSLESSSYYTFFTETDPSGPPINGNGNGFFGIVNPLNALTLEEALNMLLDYLFYLMVIVAPILIIYGAAIMLFSHGDPKQTTKAKQIIFWALIALVVAGLAKGLPVVIQNMLGI